MLARAFDSTMMILSCDDVHILLDTETGLRCVILRPGSRHVYRQRGVQCYMASQRHAERACDLYAVYANRILQLGSTAGLSAAIPRREYRRSCPRSPPPDHDESTGIRSGNISGAHHCSSLYSPADQWILHVTPRPRQQVLLIHILETLLLARIIHNRSGLRYSARLTTDCCYS